MNKYEAIAQALKNELDFYALYVIEGHLVAIVVTDTIIVAGDTYPIRERLTSAGFAWNKAAHAYTRTRVNEFPNHIAKELGATQIDPFARYQELVKVSQAWGELKASFYLDPELASDMRSFAVSAVFSHVISVGILHNIAVDGYPKGLAMHRYNPPAVIRYDAYNRDHEQTDFDREALRIARALVALGGIPANSKLDPALFETE